MRSPLSIIERQAFFPHVCPPGAGTVSICAICDWVRRQWAEGKYDQDVWDARHAARRQP